MNLNVSLCHHLVSSCNLARMNDSISNFCFCRYACNQMNPAFSQVFMITADDNELEDLNNAGSTYIDMPFLERGYDWYQYVTVDVSKYDRRTAKKVGINYLPQDGLLTDEHVNDHMAFMKPKRLPTDPNYALTYRELETDRVAIIVLQLMNG